LIAAGRNSPVETAATRLISCRASSVTSAAPHFRAPPWRKAAAILRGVGALEVCMFKRISSVSTGLGADSHVHRLQRPSRWIWSRPCSRPSACRRSRQPASETRRVNAMGRGGEGANRRSVGPSLVIAVAERTSSRWRKKAAKRRKCAALARADWWKAFDVDTLIGGFLPLRSPQSQYQRSCFEGLHRIAPAHDQRHASTILQVLLERE